MELAPLVSSDSPDRLESWAAQVPVVRLVLRVLPAIQASLDPKVVLERLVVQEVQERVDQLEHLDRQV